MASKPIEDVEIDKYRHLGSDGGGENTLQFHFYYYGSSNGLNERTVKLIFRPAFLFQRLNVITRTLVPLTFEQ